MTYGKPNIRQGIYRHYKGGIYKPIDIGRHTETLEWMVISKDINGRTWIRPYKMWFESVEVDGKIVARFEFIGEGW